MASEDQRSADVALLHPAIRQSVQDVQQQLNSEGFDFHIFEAYRSPQRQAYLYAQGRTRPGGIVTYAKSWTSYHQYGLAVDFVLKTNGNWDWSSSGPKAQAWKRLHEVGRAHGLEPLNFEEPHLQMAGLRIDDLHAGRFPPNGDTGWAENLEAVIAGWTGSPQAPPAPASVSRPALAPGLATAATAHTFNVDRPASPASAATAATVSSNFARIQPFIEKWEGGYSNNPQDRGGPTNMGITLATLRAWRHRDDLTAQDVQQLSREEARSIFKARYFDVVRGDDLPLQVAAAAYNAAVLHGTSRAAEFLQNSLARCGVPVDVDHIIGPDTVRAVASVNAPTLCNAFLDIEDAYFRALPDFSVFGKGWLNRLNDLRSFITALPATAAVTVTATGATTMPEQPQAQPNLAEIFGKVEELLQMIGRKPNVPIGTPAAQGTPQDALARIGQIVEILRKLGLSIPAIPNIDATTTTPLTPVNAALGQTIGNALDGRKSAIGIIGSVLVSLLGAAAPKTAAVAGAAATIAPGAEAVGGVLSGILPMLGIAVPYLQPIMLGLAAWGVLGKLDKYALTKPPQSPG